MRSRRASYDAKTSKNSFLNVRLSQYAVSNTVHSELATMVYPHVYGF